MGWRGNVARMGEMRKMRRDFLEDRDVNGRIILKWMLSNRVNWINLAKSRLCQHSNEVMDISEHLSDDIRGNLTGRPDIRYVAVQQICLCSVTVFTSETEGEVFQFRSCSDGSKCKGKCRNLILLVVLYGCETWSLTSREERRLTVFENRVLRRTFGPKRDEVTGEQEALGNSILTSFV
jgi:hypothetical protein